ncbi:MAG: hypothetical protein DRJ47_08480 [Thermoprotei archaeon]|nr:MAG: hypothetical protein DRJ47_08480 [Thermoprotei archaeon]
MSEVVETRTFSFLKKTNEIFDNLSKSINQLDYLWEKYLEAAQGVLKEWEVSRNEIEHTISVLKSLKDFYLEKKQETEVRKEIGLIDESEYNILLEKYDKEVNSADQLLKDIEDKFKILSLQLEKHFSRLILGSIDEQEEALERQLETLEKLYSEGKISEEIYQKLKDKLEKLLRKK